LFSLITSYAYGYMHNPPFIISNKGGKSTQLYFIISKSLNKL